MFSLNLAHKFQFINTLIFTNPHKQSNGIFPPKQLPQRNNNFYKATCNCTHNQNTALHWKTNLTWRNTYKHPIWYNKKNQNIDIEEYAQCSGTPHYRNKSISTSTCIHVWITLTCITHKSIELRAQNIFALTSRMSTRPFTMIDSQ